MPQKHKPKRLEQMALTAVGSWIKLVGLSLIEPVYVMTQRDPNQGYLLLEGMIAVVRDTLFAAVPWYRFDDVAELVLKSVNELIDETKFSYDCYNSTMAVFLNKMKVVVTLTEVAMYSHLKNMDVPTWPKIMRHILMQNLFRLEGLEKLNLGSGSGGWDTLEMEKNILCGVHSMANLTTFCLCFDTTNAIISALGKTCLSLQILDITSSRSVTDRGLPALYNCKKLEEVNLFRTSVTNTGFSDLLLELPNIRNLGKCEDFGSILERLHSKKSNQLSLEVIDCKDMTFEKLKLLIHYCPNLTTISMFHEEQIADLIVLKDLKNLKHLKFLNCDFYSDKVKELLEFKGKDLESLNLEHVEQINLNALIFISQYCPNLKYLIFCNCEFSDHNPTYFDCERQHFSKFAHLEKLVCIADCSVVHLEFLLTHCKNVKHIELGSSTGINDAIFSQVLNQNSMKSLEKLTILYSDDLSMQTVELLMTHCDQLNTISRLESWGGISEEELENFKYNICCNNINLIINPNL